MFFWMTGFHTPNKTSEFGMFLNDFFIVHRRTRVTIGIVLTTEIPLLG